MTQYERVVEPTPTGFEHHLRCTGCREQAPKAVDIEHDPDCPLTGGREIRTDGGGHAAGDTECCENCSGEMVPTSDWHADDPNRTWQRMRRYQCQQCNVEGVTHTRLDGTRSTGDGFVELSGQPETDQLSGQQTLMTDGGTPSSDTERSAEEMTEDGREPTDLQKEELDGMATWALEHGIDFAGFNDDGTIPDTDGEVHESPFIVPNGDAGIGREFDGYAECDGCATTYGWKQKLTLLEDGEPVCSECAEEPEAVAQIIYVSNTDGESWHRIGQRLSLEAVRSLHTDSDRPEGDR